ncbi:MAG: FHA domain-containing protein [Anaerolineaceae bacterium]|nr:FHA domain-containing protein [Anaerolineaceae bacterium]
MAICTKCSNKEPDGTLFCTKCGETMVLSEQTKVEEANLTPSIDTIDSSVIQGLSKSMRMEGEINVAIAAKINNRDVVIRIQKNEYTLGRAALGQAVIPDFDLTPYDGLEKGVSRIHALIMTTEKEMFIRDLTSINGTQINGIRLSPNMDYPIKTGDLISFGRLSMEIKTINRL